jgi:hypothetical protein
VSAATTNPSGDQTKSLTSTVVGTRTEADEGSPAAKQAVEVTLEEVLAE